MPCRRRFGRDTRASTALQFALALPVLGAMGGVAIDFANAMSLKSKLQQIADSAALGAAREIRLGNTTDASVQAAVSQNVTAMSSTLKNVSSVSATSTLSSDRTTVKVDLTGNSSSTFAALTGVSIGTVKVSATARMMGGAPLCFMSLNLTASNAMQMDQNAQLTANNCAVYSNSNHRNSISIKNSARVTAATICAAGGVTGNSSGMSPAPQLDCPQLPDPLAARAAPTVGACTQNALVVTGGTQSLNPGVYCGGLRVTGGAVVTLNPGVFIIKDGPLKVDNNSSLSGSDVGFYLTGSGAVLNFDAGNNVVSLGAPTSGALAGLLFFEDRAAPVGQNHQILSDQARMLLGTIYLPQGNFNVGANNPVADQSAYTILVTNTISAAAGPNLVLNSNYGASTVPVPDGVGPGRVALQR